MFYAVMRSSSASYTVLVCDVDGGGSYKAICKESINTLSQRNLFVF